MFVRAVICGLGGLMFGIEQAPLLGFALGAALGAVWGLVADLETTVRKLKQELEDQKRRPAPTPAAAPIRDETTVPRAPAAQALRPDALPPVETFRTEAARLREARALENAAAVAGGSGLIGAAAPPVAHREDHAGAPAGGDPDATVRRVIARPEPDIFDRALKAAKDWMFTGNIPVKVGVLLSFLGVAFLLKYAVDEGLLSFPIEFRLMAIAAGALGMLVVGWRLRARERVYALTIQGGGIAILYLTVFAAFRLYQLMSAPPAFALLVLLTAGLATLAVLQKAQVLAVIGVLGGFAAPLLISTGTGSHVALFSYYLVLNLAIAGIAWHSAWRPLNWLGFVCTFAIGTAWGFPYYKPEFFDTVEPFLIAHFLLYTVVAVVFALRHGPQLKGYVDGTLIFGLPLVCFGLQYKLVEPWDKGLAWSALALAVFYVALASLLAKRAARDASKEARLLAECFIALGVGFATVAIPLALDAQWTSASWALEGAGLIWVGVRQGRLLSRWSGVALQFLAVYMLLHGWREMSPDPALLNGRFLGGLVLALGAAAGARFLEIGPPRHAEHERLASWALLGLAVMAWYATGLNEIQEQVVQDYEIAVQVLFVLGSAAASAALGRRLASAAWHGAATLALPGLALLALHAPFDKSHPAQDFGWLAWPLGGLAYLWTARQVATLDALAGRVLALGGLWIGALLVAWQAHWLLGEVGEGAIWSWAAVVATFALLAQGLGRFSGRWPSLIGLGDGVLAAAALGLATLLIAGSRGDPSPLPYLPLLNPLDLAALHAFAVAALWWRRHREWLELETPVVLAFAAGFGLLLITMDVVRCFHHWNDLPFRASAAFRDDGLQAALSLVWATLGVAAMFLGARRGLRLVWMAGAALMAVVVLKLFLVELGNTGTVARIVSFIGVGVLLLVIGYLAPLPSKKEEPKP